MGIFDYIKRKRAEKDLPLIARVDLAALAKEREENAQLGEVSILAAADYTKRLPSIRLVYADIVKVKNYHNNKKYLSEMYGSSSVFRLPRHMKIEDSFKIVSYLSEKVERDHHLTPASEDSVVAVSKILDTYGFEMLDEDAKTYNYRRSTLVPFKRRVGIPELNEIEGVVDLFTVNGDFRQFKRTDLFPRYFDWFTPNVTKEVVDDIYKKIGQEHLLPDYKSPVNEN